MLDNFGSDKFEITSNKNIPIIEMKRKNFFIGIYGKV
jgi:hypothetical protein